MKNGCKPTLRQKKVLGLNKMDHSQWLVVKVLADRLICTHRISKKQKEAFFKVV